MGVRGQLSGFPPPVIGSLVGTIRSQVARSRAKLVWPATARRRHRRGQMLATRKL